VGVDQVGFKIKELSLRRFSPKIFAKGIVDFFPILKDLRVNLIFV